MNLVNYIDILLPVTLPDKQQLHSKCEYPKEVFAQ